MPENGALNPLKGRGQASNAPDLLILQGSAGDMTFSHFQGKIRVLIVRCLNETLTPAGSHWERKRLRGFFRIVPDFVRQALAATRIAS